MNKAIIIIPLFVAVSFLIFPFVAYYGNTIMFIKSDSMVPALKPHDLIIVQRISIDEIEVGDIAVFDSHLEHIGIIAHRAVEKFDDHGEIAIDTKGDHVDDRDPWMVHDEDLIGKVIDIIPIMGIFLIEPIRYTLVAVIIITSISLIKEISSESKVSKNSQK